MSYFLKQRSCVKWERRYAQNAKPLLPRRLSSSNLLQRHPSSTTTDSALHCFEFARNLRWYGFSVVGTRGNVVGKIRCRCGELSWLEKLEEEGEIPGINKSLRKRGSQGGMILRCKWLCDHVAWCNNLEIRGLLVDRARKESWGACVLVNWDGIGVSSVVRLRRFTFGG